MCVKKTWKTQKNKTSIEIVVVPKIHLSNEKTGCLVYIGDYTTHLSENFTNHYNDPY